MKNFPLHNSLTGLACVLALSACAVGPDYQRPPVDAPPAYKESGDWQKAQPHDTIDRGAWWSMYNDAILDALEKQVDVSNQNLKAFEAAYRESIALVDQSQASLFPTVSVDASAIRAGNGKHTPPTVTTYNVGPSASWAPDVWGRIRRTIESDVANAEASAADLASARLSAQATLATAYFDLRIQDEVRDLLKRTVDDDTRIMKIVQNQYNAGTAAKADVLAAQTQLESVRSQAINADLKRAQLEHAIAVLTGRAPSEFTLAPEKFATRIPNVPGEVPSMILERRPDVAAAERAMIAANAQVGIAETAFFPDITLSASYGYVGTAIGSLIQASHSMWTIGPTIAETVFDAGAREAQVEQAQVTYAQTVANYRQTVLTAFQQVEDQLAAQRILGDQAKAQNAAVTDARRSEQLTLNQYKEGIVPYNTVLTAQLVTLSNEQSDLAVKDSRFDASVALIQALGGDWDMSQINNPRLPEPSPEQKDIGNSWWSGVMRWL